MAGHNDPKFHRQPPPLRHHVHDVNPPGVAPLTWVLGRRASPVPIWTRTRPSSLPTQAFALVGAAPSPPAHSPPGRRPPWLLLGPLGWSRGGCYSSPTVSLSFRFADRRFPTSPNRSSPTPPACTSSTPPEGSCSTPQIGSHAAFFGISRHPLASENPFLATGKVA